MRNINCPLCGLEIKKAGKTLFCKCGWSKSCNEKLQKLIQLLCTLILIYL